jgi:ferredoxin--NADP+ reductase
MSRIIYKEDLKPKVHLFRIEAPLIAKKAQAGQFIILKIDEKGERIPLTIADWDQKEGSITIIFMELGATTCRLAQLEAGDELTSFVGPLGKPTHIDNYGTVVCVAGGFAVAQIMPVARAMKKAGNKVISIVGVRSKELLFWEGELAKYSDELIITTNDGSWGHKGLVTEPLKTLLDGEKKIDRVLAIGPSVMMKYCSLTTKPYNTPTFVSLNPIMVDGTGMCGCCRVTVGGQTKFACVDGPDFDGHQVDWDLLISRQRTYLPQEKEALEKHQCRRSEQGEK